MKLIQILYLSILFISCETSIKQEVNENMQLKMDAQNGKTYEHQFFYVFTDSSANLYTKNNTKFSVTNKTIMRGDTYSVIDSISGYNEYTAIKLSKNEEDLYYIKRPFAHFMQPFEGMKYAVIGFTEKDQFIEEYNSTTQSYYKKKLASGSPYFYVITKDDHYVNIWDMDTKKTITGRFCCDLNIAQAEDHIKINPKFKSKLTKAILKK